YVSATFEKAPKGRPHKLFSISVRGRDALFGKYDLILDLMADTVIKFQGRESAISLFTSMAENIATANSSVHGNGDSDIELLRSLGFEPERRTEGPVQLFISKNCPILQMSKKYPELTCDTFHTAFLKRLERVESIRLRQTISRGADECIHEMSSGSDEIKFGL
ncbi:MAG: hypothetical protein OK457_09570, partial [Thaumarchaeota archaeon]|nr:hypothetical protein [Nitrososphaerota archaeon]